MIKTLALIATLSAPQQSATLEFCAPEFEDYQLSEMKDEMIRIVSSNELSERDKESAKVELKRLQNKLLFNASGIIYCMSSLAKV